MSTGEKLTKARLGMKALAEELQNISLACKRRALVTRCFRSTSGTGTPLSASFRIPTIWVSLSFDFRMTAPDAGAVYLRLSIDRGAYATTRGAADPPFQASSHGTVTRSGRILPVSPLHALE